MPQSLTKLTSAIHQPIRGNDDDVEWSTVKSPPPPPMPQSNGAGGTIPPPPPMPQSKGFGGPIPPPPPMPQSKGFGGHIPSPPPMPQSKGFGGPIPPPQSPPKTKPSEPIDGGSQTQPRSLLDEIRRGHELKSVTARKHPATKATKPQSHDAAIQAAMSRRRMGIAGIQDGQEQIREYVETELPETLANIQSMEDSKRNKPCQEMFKEFTSEVADHGFKSDLFVKIAEMAKSACWMHPNSLDIIREKLDLDSDVEDDEGAIEDWVSTIKEQYKQHGNNSATS